MQANQLEHHGPCILVSKDVIKFFLNVQVDGYLA